MDKYNDPVPAFIIEEIAKIANDWKSAAVAVSSYGHRLRLKSKKPSDPVMAYVWRQARFHSGADMRIPIQCHFDLERGISERFSVEISFHRLDESRKKVLDLLDSCAEKVLVEMGLSTTKAAEVWGRSLGMT